KLLKEHYDKISGGGPAGRDLSSGRGIKISMSFGGRTILPCFQSSFACSMRSLLLDTKFHQIYRSPNGSPPSNIRVVLSLALMRGSLPGVNTNSWPGS